LLEKHKEEISRDLEGWRNHARREFNRILPHKHPGATPDDAVTLAAKLKAQGRPWREIYARTRKNGWAAQQRLREAIRARHRRHKKRTNQCSLS